MLPTPKSRNSFASGSSAGPEPNSVMLPDDPSPGPSAVRTSLEASLRRIETYLTRARAPFALVGGLAVSGEQNPDSRRMRTPPSPGEATRTPRH